MKRSASRIVVGALVVLVALSVAAGGWAYVVGSRPGNENFVAKSADWFRDHHLNGVAKIAAELD